MTKTLQKKFITTAMLAITVLILVLLGAINGIYGLISGRQMERMLGMLADNGGGSLEAARITRQRQAGLFGAADRRGYSHVGPVFSDPL